MSKASDKKEVLMSPLSISMPRKRRSSDRRGWSQWQLPLISMLAGMVVSMATFYATSYHKFVSRDEVKTVIEELRPGPPWAQDKGYIVETQRDLQRRVAELEVKVYKLVRVDPLHKKLVKQVKVPAPVELLQGKHFDHAKEVP